MRGMRNAVNDVKMQANNPFVFFFFFSFDSIHTQRRKHFERENFYGFFAATIDSRQLHWCVYVLCVQWSTVIDDGILL